MIRVEELPLPLHIILMKGDDYMVDLFTLHSRLINNDPTVVQEIYQKKPEIQQIALDLISSFKDQGYTNSMDYTLDLLMKICNIFYNYFDSTTLIDDGIYDMLMIIYRQRMPKTYQVGSEPVNIDFTGMIQPDEEVDNFYCPLSFIDFANGETLDNWLFKDDLLVSPPFNPAFFDDHVDRSKFPVNDKHSLVVPHKYSKLVGTLDKCKFTLVSEAAAAGVLDDPTIKVFERDFLADQVSKGIVNPNHIELLLELKMDGMSVEAEVTDKIISARSRGDTGLDLADDLTTVFKDYQFPYAVPVSDVFGMKFECIITKTNLDRLAQYRGRSYKNARNAIIGLIKSKDAYAFRDLVTLVPLETSLDVDPITEVKFMNKYYTKDVYLPYAYVSGDYQSVLYQVYRFVKEAEAMRPIANYLYDGIVVHHIDPNIKARLGRENSVNKYSMAIKFNPLKKQTIFRGYTYTVGQDGRITPMAHYDPVEFLGTIHSKSSAHSYGRFKELRLAVGDKIEVTYVNDVMPYVTKPYAGAFSGEFEGNNPPEVFPTTCPCCGTPLIFSEGGGGDSAICPNLNCPDRKISRLVNMLDKLSIKGFAESSIRKLGISTFSEFLNIKQDHAVNTLGFANGTKLIQTIQQFLATPIPDYRLIGSLGFTGIAAGTWKKILSAMSFQELMRDDDAVLIEKLKSFKGIGSATAETIVNERPMFLNDMNFIIHLPNTQYTYGQHLKTIRWTGCRDEALESQLEQMGYDASSKLSVTKTTNMLIVPYVGFQSTKMNKCGPNTLIVPIDELKSNMEYYLSLVK